MSRKARSRALLRNLRKQARRGNLSALERKQLLQQEKRFRKGRSGFRKGLGAGLGAGLGIAAAQFLASPAFKQLLENKPSLSDLRDRLKKEGVPADAVEDVANTVKDADKDTPPAEIVKEVKEKVDPAAESTAAEGAAPAEERGQTAGLLDSLGAMEGPAPARGVGEPLMDPAIFDNLEVGNQFDGIEGMYTDAETGAVRGGRPAPSGLGGVFNNLPDDVVSEKIEPRNLTGEFLDAMGNDDLMALERLGVRRRMTPLEEILDGQESNPQGRTDDQLDLTAGDFVLEGEDEEEDFPVDFDPIMSRPSGLRDSRPGAIRPDGTRGPRVPIDTTPRVLEGDELRDEVARRQAARASDAEMRENRELDERLRREGGYDPRTGQRVVSERQQRIDDEFDRDFERSAFTDAERAAELRNARLDAMDESAALGATLDEMEAAARLANTPQPQMDFDDLGNRPALTTPNNALSRRVNVNDPGLRLPIVDIQEDPENFFDPQEEAELLRFRNRGRALPGGFGDVQDRLSDFGEPLLVPGRPSQVLDNRAPRGLALSSEQLLADQARRARQSRRRGSRSGIPYRQEMGGKNPKMADLMKKVKAKYGIR